MIAYALDASGSQNSVGADFSLLLSAVVIVLLTAGVVMARRRC